MSARNGMPADREIPARDNPIIARGNNWGKIARRNAQSGLRSIRELFGVRPESGSERERERKKPEGADFVFLHAFHVSRSHARRDRDTDKKNRLDVIRGSSRIPFSKDRNATRVSASFVPRGISTTRL